MRFRLRQLGADVTVLEASERRYFHHSKKWIPVRGWPQFLRFPASVWQLVHFAILRRNLFRGSRAKRYILKCKLLHLAPFLPMALL